MNAADVREVAVIGAGTMGAGIAGLFARAGCNVRMVDRSDDILARGMTAIRGAQEGLRAAKAISVKDAAAALRRVKLTTSMEHACDGVQLVLEAISEDLPLKQETFHYLDEACPSCACWPRTPRAYRSRPSAAQPAGPAGLQACISGTHRTLSPWWKS